MNGEPNLNVGGNSGAQVATTREGASGTEICTVAAECQTGYRGTGNGQFGDWDRGDYIAITPDDEVYVGDENRIQRFNTDGVYQGEIALPGETVISLDVDPNPPSDLYVAFAFGTAIIPNPNVHKLSPAGASLCTALVDDPMAVAIDRDGNLYVIDAPEFASEVNDPRVLEFDSSCDRSGVAPYSQDKLGDASNGIVAGSAFALRGLVDAEVAVVRPLGCKRSARPGAPRTIALPGGRPRPRPPACVLEPATRHLKAQRRRSLRCADRRARKTLRRDLQG